MQSSLIGKIEKARRYSAEPDRVKFSDFTINFHGEHADYTLIYRDNRWHCSCDFFERWGLCSHTMAVQKMLKDQLPKEAISGVNPAA